MADTTIRIDTKLRDEIAILKIQNGKETLEEMIKDLLENYKKGEK